MTSLIQIVALLPLESFMTVTLLPMFGVGMVWCRECARRYWQ